MSEKDTLYSGSIERVRDFVFDEAVAGVFDDMIARSVPLYREVQYATARLAAEHAQADAPIYDLGCSTGATLLELQARVPATTPLIGVDRSEPMLARCRENLEQAGCTDRVTLRCADIQELSLEAPCAVILNYTLQFLPPEQRAGLLTRIHAALQPGGACLLSEKIMHHDPEIQATLTDLHHDFKRRHGYSELEIARKREALEDVLVPLSVEENLALCREAGFARVETCLKWYSFATFLAVKAG